MFDGGDGHGVDGGGRGRGRGDGGAGGAGAGVGVGVGAGEEGGFGRRRRRSGPFAGRGVDDVRLGKGADFGHDGFFLLEQHAAGFEVADARDHGALHDGAAFVVFDVAHPAGAVEGDFFGEALFFEVADGVVVGVGEEVLDRRRGFDVVF